MYVIPKEQEVFIMTPSHASPDKPLLNKLIPMDHIAGYGVRSGLFDLPGATALPGAVNFTVQSSHATAISLVLFAPESDTPFAVLPYPDHYRIGHVWSMIVFDLDITAFEYAFQVDGPVDAAKGFVFDQTKFLLDPWAKAVTGQSAWGKNKGNFYKARVVQDDFDWGQAFQPEIPMEALIIYELHVRGFSIDPSSGVVHPGSFAGIKEKIPYLKALGINAVELMPVFEFDEYGSGRDVGGTRLLDYWGYNTLSFMTPNTSYAATDVPGREGDELKSLVKALNANGIEVILDVVFNHTAEGGEGGPFISFKGFDNTVYYMLTPDGHYYNFSGCGNTLNCNHPVVRQMILNCLRYWVIHYRVDGFRFDLASILGRNEDGSPNLDPPLLESLAYDPILGKVKLIAEAWDAGGLYQVGSFPAFNRFAEWNGKYRDDMRSFLKGDDGKAEAAALRLTGSPDLYHPELRQNASINFLNCHDGFTLYDLYAYNTKHNEANGWDNTDGDNNGLSWNCGAEGETDDPQVLALRRRMIKNAWVALMGSRGTPMFFAGDEFGNSQSGNNNAYCQDSPLSWLDWSLTEKNKDLLDFATFMIHFRKAHPVIWKNTGSCSLGFPAISLHGLKPWVRTFAWEEKMAGVLFAGRSADGKTDDIVYIAINAYWMAQTVDLPLLLGHAVWHQVVHTAETPSFVPEDQAPALSNTLTLAPRSAVVLIARE